MLKITIIALGKLKEKSYQDLENEFLKRLSPFAKVQIEELPEIPYHQKEEIEKIKIKEAKIILKYIKPGSNVVLLDENGHQKNSKNFAKFLEKTGEFGTEIIFVIGSGIGLADSLKKHANDIVSLSMLTFPHNMARIILIEQIYRACTILAGKEYHK